MGPSDIKMAKNMMDGPVLGCFAAVFGTVRQKIAQKVVGRCLETMGWTVRVRCLTGQKRWVFISEAQDSVVSVIR